MIKITRKTVTQEHLYTSVGAKETRQMITV